MRLLSFNVNGIRAIAGKSFITDMRQMNADVICLQETKATVDQVKDVVAPLGYAHVYANEAARKGYSGTAVISKTEPVSVVYDMGVLQHDEEGRVICAEYDRFYLVTVYVPNSGSELLRLPYRKTWDTDFLAYLKGLEAKKPVIVCGDFNVAHKAIDLARPKENYNKSAGFMQEEIDGIDAFIGSGLADSWRVLNGDEVKYTWWSYRAGARGKNIGWRIDYFLVSESFIPQLKAATIHNEIMGSDHCPVGLELSL
ncbi:exodeoxyribonuclease III [Fluviicola sp.]|jgi:exodeoxyribonuclease-3|uniref:exodeoxyribonuclease III n=1 Tax=Fluviicola sp. TaxID=1917219 RepID=UPI002818FB41|nr:exodeoxyribonuclease III [Fluviicola sp.]MDR0802828.1 exodeoxyribonuclease III [Fluviicola sp.]